MSFFFVWLITSVVASLAMIGELAWWFRHPAPMSTPTLNLGEIILITMATLCPIIQWFVGLAMLAYFFNEIAPNITVFGKR
jgi:hypothetical protein